MVEQQTPSVGHYIDTHRGRRLTRKFEMMRGKMWLCLCVFGCVYVLVLKVFGWCQQVKPFAGTAPSNARFMMIVLTYTGCFGCLLYDYFQLKVSNILQILSWEIVSKNFFIQLKFKTIDTRYVPQRGKEHQRAIDKIKFKEIRSELLGEDAMRSR